MMEPSIGRLNHLEELEELNLDKSKYTIIGSGIMAVCGIRENNDIDLSVTEDLFDEISKDPIYSPVIEMYPSRKFYSYKNISIYIGFWPITKSPQQLIEESINVDGYNFISIETLIEWKKLTGRYKDKKDLELLKNAESTDNKNVLLYKVTDQEYGSLIVSSVKYRKIYIPGKTVSADEGTLGLMLFNSLRNAAKCFNDTRAASKILKVRANSTLIRPISISLCVSDYSLDKFYKRLHKNEFCTFDTAPLKGTVCCMSIKVLGEVPQSKINEYIEYIEYIE